MSQTKNISTLFAERNHFYGLGDLMCLVHRLCNIYGSRVWVHRYLEEDKDIYVTYNIQLICFVNEKKMAHIPRYQVFMGCAF